MFLFQNLTGRPSFAECVVTKLLASTTGFTPARDARYVGISSGRGSAAVTSCLPPVSVPLLSSCPLRHRRKYSLPSTPFTFLPSAFLPRRNNPPLPPLRCNNPARHPCVTFPGVTDSAAVARLERGMSSPSQLSPNHNALQEYKIRPTL